MVDVPGALGALVGQIGGNVDRRQVLRRQIEEDLCERREEVRDFGRPQGFTSTKSKAFFMALWRIEIR